MTNPIEYEIIQILKSQEQRVKMGSDGDYEVYQAVTDDCYKDVAEKVALFIQSITDPENQPNQYGIKL